MKSNNYRLLVIDIDGTLISKDSVISGENKEALFLARENGVQVALSTGRTILSCRRIIDQLELDGCHICFDGALVSDCSFEERVYIRIIDKPLLREMIEFSRANDIELELASAMHYFTEKETWATEIKRTFFDIETTIGDLLVPGETEDIIRGDIVYRNRQEKDKADIFMGHFRDRIRFSQAHSPQFPDVTFINVIAQGTSKGEALKALAGHLDIPLEQVAAAGDWINDIPLLQTAGLGIAMGNAHDDVKAVADHVTLDVEENGLAAAIRKFLL